MVSCRWDPDRNEWSLQWKACGRKCHHRVKASALGGDKDAAGEIAAFMKIKIENATRNRGNEAHFNMVRDKAIWRFAQRGFRASEALRQRFKALPSEVFALRKRFRNHLELCPARFSRFGNASEDIWSFAKRGFRISEALRERFGALPSEVFAFRNSIGSRLELCPARFSRF